MSNQIHSPAHPRHCKLISPNDTVTFDPPLTGLSFASAGALNVVTVGGETVLIPSGALAAGVQHALQLTKILATSTQATGIVGYW